MQPSPAFIGRQPVLNRNQQIIGYQLLFRPVSTGTVPAADDELANGAHVLINTLSNMDAAALIGNKFAFIKVGQGLLVSDFLELLHPRRV
ncbi:MAG: diguanylate phosphodiesterase, partial [Microvirgula sp.]